MMYFDFMINLPSPKSINFLMGERLNIVSFRNFCRESMRNRGVGKRNNLFLYELNDSDETYDSSYEEEPKSILMDIKSDTDSDPDEIVIVSKINSPKKNSHQNSPKFGKIGTRTNSPYKRPIPKKQSLIRKSTKTNSETQYDSSDDERKKLSTKSQNNWGKHKNNNQIRNIGKPMKKDIIYSIESSSSSSPSHSPKSQNSSFPGCSSEQTPSSPIAKTQAKHDTIGIGITSIPHSNDRFFIENSESGQKTENLAEKASDDHPASVGKINICEPINTIPSITPIDDDKKEGEILKLSVMPSFKVIREISNKFISKTINFSLSEDNNPVLSACGKGTLSSISEIYIYPNPINLAPKSRTSKKQVLPENVFDVNDNKDDNTEFHVNSENEIDMKSDTKTQSKEKHIAFIKVVNGKKRFLLKDSNNLKIAEMKFNTSYGAKIINIIIYQEYPDIPRKLTNLKPTVDSSSASWTVNLHGHYAIPSSKNTVTIDPATKEYYALIVKTADNMLEVIENALFDRVIVFFFAISTFMASN
ncbi:hypothetical protein TRFO_06472 [Tritrichomonas foetus]|uniref:Tubby C-terminal domain-containing protein n=1 Tax=Tritrichomonas foetus TaxID=1144522 RepID=A0A1J4JYU6_9EUKA|nr:hypothetical protein TRFO_06472 [Tritrichomonas foetus]|eukprot:OHT04147.1 hypothetical protein TRFO_06472 [Tritrichomonas foetus]